MPWADGTVCSSPDAKQMMVRDFNLCLLVQVAPSYTSVYVRLVFGKMSRYPNKGRLCHCSFRLSVSKVIRKVVHIIFVTWAKEESI